MRKFLLSILAVLFISGTVFAASIPGSADPKNNPEIWTQEVYNSAGSNLTSGSVVVWNFGAVSSPAVYSDRLSYVTTTTTANQLAVAGVVVSDSILINDTGTIAIYGPVYALVADSSDAVTANQTVATTTVAGQCGQANAASVNQATLGYCIQASPNSLANGGYGGTDGNDFVMMPIFVRPSIQ